MQNNFISAPHQGATPGVPTGSPNAALLIDFDNVTMGIRSDLTRQLKELLNSDIIRGKVAVQRAYADWRRYAQYIVPLSEASVDLIFAPAYGSSKKNATDIRLAIDALELVFTRPEIGVYILLSGDSDFSSLVLKLKEYGKYVIGVGLRESASDLLVQNCDEYFSYSSLTGLTKAGEEDTISAIDPWELVERAVGTMAEENDVMRSDRLKQVMLDLDPNFDEGELGYSKFNKFLTEAASRNKLALKKLDNGQYEVQPFEKGAAVKKEERRDDRRRGRGRREREPRAEAPRQEEQRREPKPEPRAERPRQPKPQPKTRERRAEDLQRGYDLLQQAIRDLIDRPSDPARDSDIKRQILEIESGWDESELGFTKFSRFLRQAHDAEIIDLQRTAEGYYEARLPSGVGSSGPKREHKSAEPGADRDQKADKREEKRQEEPRAERGGRQGRGETQATAAAEDRARPDARTEKDVEAEAPKPGREAGADEAATPEEKPEVISAVTAGDSATEPEKPEEEKPEAEAASAGATKRGGGYGRRGGGRRGKAEGPPPLLPGQVVGGTAPAKGKAAEAEPTGEAATSPAEEAATPPAEPSPEPKPETREPVESKAAEEARTAETEPQAGRGDEEAGAAKEADRTDAGRDGGPEPSFDPEELGLPIDEGSVIRYLSNSYQGVGQKTAEALIEAFGADRVFNGLNSQPEKVREVLGSGRRTDVLLDAWERDFRRRTGAGAGDKQPVS